MIRTYSPRHARTAPVTEIVAPRRSAEQLPKLRMTWVAEVDETGKRTLRARWSTGH